MGGVRGDVEEAPLANHSVRSTVARVGRRSARRTLTASDQPAGQYACRLSILGDNRT
jgi:hypothetical protein